MFISVGFADLSWGQGVRAMGLGVGVERGYEVGDRA